MRRRLPSRRAKAREPHEPVTEPKRLDRRSERPGALTIVLAAAAAVALAVAAAFCPGAASPDLPLLADLFSVCAAVAFLYGAWHSIETRAALARLETMPKAGPPGERGGSERAATWTPEAENPRPGRRSGSVHHVDLAAEGKAALTEQLQRELLRHVRIEWRAYLIGSVFLADTLALSIMARVAGSGSG
jgi:hypothetical protein